MHLCVVHGWNTLLTRRLAQPLPGWDAQKLACPPGRPEDAPDVLDKARRAGVVALICPNEADEPCLVLMRRTRDGSPHSGQLAFPGGAEEGVDEDDLMRTAMREMHEEVGVELRPDQIAGPLSPLYIPPSRFWVQPYVACLAHTPSFKLQAEEVASVLMVPLTSFPEARERWPERPVSGGLYKAPGMPVDGDWLWGATAMMVAELLVLLKETNFAP